MNVLGYIGFSILIFLAATWTLGVRVKLDAGVHTIVGALFFLVAAIWLAVSDVDKIHSLWIVPCGIVLLLFVSLLGAYVRPLFIPFRLLASIFAAIIRVGIPADRIRAEQEAGLKATVDEWARRRQGRNDH